MPNIKLLSSDGDEFEVDAEIAKCSTTIKNMLEDLNLEDDDEAIPIPNVSSAILKKIIEWAIHHKDDPPLIEDDENDEKTNIEISPWDVDFLNVDRDTFFGLLLAANFLDIKSLLDVACKTIAKKIHRKTPDEIRKEFGIKAASL